jgi:hypothetical protein
MAKNDQSLMTLIRGGNVNLDQLKEAVGAQASGLVSVSDWGVCYSSATGELSEYCTVTSNNPGNPITGIGVIAYSGNGSTMLCVQYTNDISTPSLMTSIGTNLYNPNQGNQVLCVVYGWTAQGSFYVPNTLTVVPCQ